MQPAKERNYVFKSGWLFVSPLSYLTFKHYKFS